MQLSSQVFKPNLVYRCIDMSSSNMRTQGIELCNLRLERFHYGSEFIASTSSQDSSPERPLFSLMTVFAVEV